MAKGVLIFFSLITLSISMYLGLALSEEPFSIKFLHVLPIFLTTLNSILATCAVFYKLSARIIFYFSLVVLVAGIANQVFLALEPDTFKYGVMPYLIFLLTEPPFFIPLLVFNAWIPFVLWKTSKTPKPELSLSDI